jgi:integrase
MTKAGIPAVGEHGRRRNCHSLRHTSARVALESGKVPIDWVSRRLGHSSIVFTVTVYGHWARDAERKQAETLAGVFKV